MPYRMIRSNQITERQLEVMHLKTELLKSLPLELIKIFFPLLFYSYLNKKKKKSSHAAKRVISLFYVQEKNNNVTSQCKYVYSFLLAANQIYKERGTPPWRRNILNISLIYSFYRLHQLQLRLLAYRSSHSLYGRFDFEVLKPCITTRISQLGTLSTISSL